MLITGYLHGKPGSSHTVGRAPKNLVIRFSMPMVDQPAAESWSHTSTVVSGPGRTCPAPDQNNACGEVSGVLGS
jgi:hypothetical protein